MSGGEEQVDDKTPIHIADIQRMGEDLVTRVSASSRSRDDGTC